MTSPCQSFRNPALVAKMGATLQFLIIQAMWQQKKTTFAGKHYRVIEAYCEPKPDPVPLIMNYFILDCGGFPRLKTLELLVLPTLNDCA